MRGRPLPDLYSLSRFNDMKQNEKPSYQYFCTGIRIGDDFAIVTNASELFCEIGMRIKTQSPFKHTMVAELTNGAHGYVPTATRGGCYFHRECLARSRDGRDTGRSASLAGWERFRSVALSRRGRVGCPTKQSCTRLVSVCGGQAR
jgi:hypothetical protein